MNNDKFAILREKQEGIKKLKEEMLEASNKIFTEMTKVIFEEHPKVKSFGWNQYTPYFNDGETCAFFANTDYIYINGMSVDESEWINENIITSYGTWNREEKVYEDRTEVPNLNYDSELVRANDEIKEFLCNFDEEFFMSQFGDHAEVTVTSEGVSVDEYEHD
jgi:hypothetical protein